MGLLLLSARKFPVLIRWNVRGIRMYESNESEFQIRGDLLSTP